MCKICINDDETVATMKHTKIQAHEFSVPSELSTEPNLPSYCKNRHPYVALELMQHKFFGDFFVEA